MDRAYIEQHLAQAEDAVALGEERIRKQKDVIERLEQGGHETAAAQGRALLVTLEDSLKLHVYDRDRIRRELDALGEGDGRP